MLRISASPAPPASTSSAHVYHAHDHRQTQADRVSLTDKTYKMAYTSKVDIYKLHQYPRVLLLFKISSLGHHQIIRVLPLLETTSR